MKYILAIQLGVWLTLFVQFQATIYQANLNAGVAAKCFNGDNYVRTIGWNKEMFTFTYYWECKEGEDHHLNIFGL